ncbi:uncharacterized protein EMH_0093270 [Eimeria mitis]|uniref:Uncharacterized protein n=1 Tax=Eimeria mitis TaxID=44415 RepID=U6KA29_9EIME|nr:uncharacterized protein EMH_0093270 [Eimeria mitis]CDJ34855.1 hypothetical protein EMH_0093270 [Eimeria mitis]
MFVAAEVLGENAKRDEWWEATLDTLPVYTRPSQSSVGRRTAEQNVLLARLLQNGLEFYKRGLRPPSGYLVPVKQIIFSTPALPALQRSPWAHFRADDEEWQQQQQLLLHLQDRLPASEPLQEEEQREEQQQQQKRQEEQQQQQLQHEEQQKQQQQHEDQQLQDQQQEEQQQQQLQ